MDEKELETLKNDLEDLERYIKEFFEFLPLAICGLTPLKTIININRFFEKLSGYNFIEIIGESFSNFFLEQKQIEFIFNEITKKGLIYNQELTLISKEGKEILVSTSVAERKNQEGNLIGYIASLTDITELKRLQEKMEEEIKERTKELQEKLKELEKFYRLTVNRELKMIELKKEVKRLKEELRSKK